MAVARGISIRRYPLGRAQLGDGVDAPRRHRCAKVRCRAATEGGVHGEVTTIGLDIAKHVFQAHGADAAGTRCSASASPARSCSASSQRSRRAWWRWRPAPARITGAREIGKLGHHVRLIPPAYVKPFVKRQKNDAADAEAICEAAQRPSMRFVPVKTEEQQANGIVFRARDLLVRQRTQCVNALRGHLSEYGYVFPQGHQPMLQPWSLASRTRNPPCRRARAIILKLLVDTFTALDGQIAASGCRDQPARRRQTRRRAG